MKALVTVMVGLACGVGIGTGQAAEFEAPVMLKAGGNPIQAERPGYAAPSWADLDGDGTSELLVGQFQGGKIKRYRHLGGLDFAAGEWIEAEGKAAEVLGVPGVW